MKKCSIQYQSQYTEYTLTCLLKLQQTLSTCLTKFQYMLKPKKQIRKRKRSMSPLIQRKIIKLVNIFQASGVLMAKHVSIIQTSLPLSTPQTSPTTIYLKIIFCHINTHAGLRKYTNMYFYRRNVEDDLLLYFYSSQYVIDLIFTELC